MNSWLKDWKEWEYRKRERDTLHGQLERCGLAWREFVRAVAKAFHVPEFADWLEARLKRFGR